MTVLAENVVIEWVLDEKKRTLVERVLWVDRPRRAVVVIALEDNSLPVWKPLDDLQDSITAGRAFRRTDPYALYADPEKNFLQKHFKRRDRAWNLIKDLVRSEPDVYLKETRGRLVQKVAAEFGTCRSEIYRLLRRYWVGGKIKNALLPSYHLCGGSGQSRVMKIDESGEKDMPDIDESDEKNRPKRGRPPKVTLVEPELVGINVDKEIVSIFECAFTLYYDTKAKRPLKSAYEKMLDKHFNVGTTIKNGVITPILATPSEQPTYGQFRYWYRKQRNLQHSIVKREGQRKFDLQSRPLLSSSTQMACGPGSIYQIDATIGDVYLVSSLNRSWIIGRPVIYFVIDVFSRMAVGLYVGLEGPSWAGAMMAIANATTDKVEFCAECGIEITSSMWPSYYLPASILGDRGEMIGYNADNLADCLDIDVANCPRYRADLKGIVEQRFHRAKCKSIEWLPGAVHERERGERDHRLDATLTLHEFTKIMIDTTLQYNLYHRMDWYEKERDMIRDEVEPVPINLWEWGIVHRMGHLRERSPDVIKLSLMPKGEATVTERGIKFEGVYFTSERALKEQWYIKARTEGTWKIPISYDPRKPEIIYLRMGGGSSFIEPCTLLDRDRCFSNTRFEEIQQYYEMERLQATKHLGTERQSDADLRAQTEQVIASAQELTKAAIPKGISKSQRTKAIRENRARDKQRNRASEGFDLTVNTERGAPSSGQGAGTEAPLAVESYVVTSVDIRRGILNMIKKNNEEQGR